MVMKLIIKKAFKSFHSLEGKHSNKT